jgi:hypothetical protein
LRALLADGEHGAWSGVEVDLHAAMANALGMSVTCRVPDIGAHTINLWLDRGIQVGAGPAGLLVGAYPGSSLASKCAVLKRASV